MDTIPAMHCSITVMNHPSLGTGWVYLHTSPSNTAGVERYHWEMEIPAYVPGTEWQTYLKDALVEIIEAL